MNYDEMPAGPEMDKLISDLVMKRTFDGVSLFPYNSDMRSPGELWSPSTNISHAWEVAEKIPRFIEVRGGTAWFTVQRGAAGWYAGYLHDEGDGWEHFAADPTAQRAICRAALKAVK